MDNSENGRACRTSSGAWQTPSCAAYHNVGTWHVTGDCQPFNFKAISGTEYTGNYDTTVTRSGARLVEHHRWLLYGDMLVDGYAPLARKLDSWWRMVDTGLRPYQAIDDELRDFIYGTVPVEYDQDIVTLGAWGNRKFLSWAIDAAFSSCLGYTLNAQQTSVAIAYGLTYGSESVAEVCEVARADGLAPYPPTPESRAPLSDVIDRMLDGEPFDTFYKQSFASKLSAIM